jgi:hypothetical protein
VLARKASSGDAALVVTMTLALAVGAELPASDRVAINIW